MIPGEENKTEAQKRAGAMMLCIELSLMDLYPGRVSSAGDFWDRKIYFRLNDIEFLVFDFAGGEGIRTYMIRSTETSDGGEDVTPIADFKVNPQASIEGVQAYIKDLVVITADAVVMDPVALVQKISEIAHSPETMQNAANSLDVVPAPSPFQPV